MDIRPGEITDILKREIREYGREIDVAETGTVLSVGDGIARVYGLDKAMAGELVEFPGGVRGMVLNLEEDNVGIAIMGEYEHIREGDDGSYADSRSTAVHAGEDRELVGVADGSGAVCVHTVGRGSRDSHESAPRRHAHDTVVRRSASARPVASRLRGP